MNSDAGAHVEHITSAEYNVKVTLSKSNQMTVDTMYINSLQSVDDDHNGEPVTSGVTEECDAKVKLYAESAGFLQLKSFSLLSLDGSAKSTDSCKNSWKKYTDIFLYADIPISIFLNAEIPVIMLNTSYWTDSYISFTLNLESGQNVCSDRSTRSSTYGKKNISDKFLKNGSRMEEFQKYFFYHMYLT